MFFHIFLYFLSKHVWFVFLNMCEWLLLLLFAFAFLVCLNQSINPSIADQFCRLYMLVFSLPVFIFLHPFPPLLLQSFFDQLLYILQHFAHFLSFHYYDSTTL